MQPYQQHSETSQEGAAHAGKASMRQRSEIMLVLHRAACDGRTAREVADLLGMEGGTVAARFASLLADKSIVKTNLKRGKPSGYIHVCKYFHDASMGETGKKNYINEQMHAEAIEIIRALAAVKHLKSTAFMERWKL